MSPDRLARAVLHAAAPTRIARSALDPRHKLDRKSRDTIEKLEWLKQRYGAQRFFFTDECVALSPAKRLCQQIIDKKLDIKWTCEMRFEKHLTRELLASMRDAGCLKIVFGLESFNQRVMDFMKKGIKKWVVALPATVSIGHARACYILVVSRPRRRRTRDTRISFGN